MRRAFYDVGWLLTEEGTTLGLSLGFDHCAEHEWGISELLADLGIVLPEFPLGVEARTMTRIPTRLQFTEFQARPRDRRRKPYAAAMLTLWEPGDFERQCSPSQAIEMNGLSFYGEPGDKHWKPTDDVSASWNCRSFAVLVRGAENIARLKELHEAFLAKDVAVGVPWAKSFFRGGLSLVLASRVPDDQKASVLARDKAHQELALAAQATGIHAKLKAAGKDWHALSPDWYDHEKKEEVIFFLNPRDQKHARSGWFTVKELEDWSEGRGPVIEDERLNAFAKHPENYNWSCRLLRGLNAKGAAPRYAEQLVWMDEEKSIPGLRYRATSDTEAVLPSGDYPFAEMMSRFAEPLPATSEVSA